MEFKCCRHVVLGTLFVGYCITPCKPAAPRPHVADILKNDRFKRSLQQAQSLVVREALRKAPALAGSVVNHLRAAQIEIQPLAFTFMNIPALVASGTRLPPLEPLDGAGAIARTEFQRSLQDVSTNIDQILCNLAESIRQANNLKNLSLEELENIPTEAESEYVKAAKEVSAFLQQPELAAALERATILLFHRRTKLINDLRVILRQNRTAQVHAVITAMENMPTQQFREINEHLFIQHIIAYPEPLIRDSLINTVDSF
jgi:hypothetical protein